MNELHWMVALEKRAEMVRAIERAHLAEERQGASKPTVRSRTAALAIAVSAAAVLLALVVLCFSRLAGPVAGLAHDHWQEHF